jgi:phosphate transport system permease protein
VVLNHVPAQVAATLDAASRCVDNRVQAIASGFGVTDTPAAYELAAAELAKVSKHWSFAKFAVVICAALAGLGAKKALATIPRS